MDFTEFKGVGGEGKPPKKETSRSISNPRWWEMDDEECANAVVDVVNFMAVHQSKRIAQVKMNTALYGDMSMVGYSGVSLQPMVSTQTQTTRLTYNLVQMCISTVKSRIAKNKPKPEYLTSGGDYKKRRKAKKMSKFVEGIFYENKSYETGNQAFVDSAVWGLGAIKVYARNGRICHERVLPHQLWVDEVESNFGLPRQLHQVIPCDRQMLMSMFPKSEDEIDNALPFGTSTDLQPTIGDMIVARESWHLPSSPEAKDGRHVISIDGHVLFSEAWEKDHYPFAFFRWERRLHGFWGQSAAEQLMPLQLEMNKLLWTISRSLTLIGGPKLFLPNGSNIPPGQLTNDLGAIIRGNSPPQYLTPPIVQPEIYEQCREVERKAFARVGISEMAVSSEKPAGLDSAKALRTMEDIETSRFSVVAQDYDQLYLDLANLSIEAVRDMHEASGEGYPVRAPVGSKTEVLEWSDVELDEDDYTIRAFPTSSLPQEPAGRLQTIQELIQAGFLSPRSGRRLLDFPDLEQVESLANAQEEWVHMCLEKIEDGGEYEPPEPFMDLQLALELAVEYYADGKVNGMEERKLELVRTFISQLNEMQAQNMAPPAPPGASPQAVPAAPPVSDLLPNAPQPAAAA